MKDFDQTYEIDEPRLGEDGKLVLDADRRPVFDRVTISRRSRLELDRAFTIGGVEFRFRPCVTPETVLEWSKFGAGEIPHMTEELAIEVMDRTVLAFLEEGQEEAWERVRSQAVECPLTHQDIRAVIRWLFEVTSGRPTERPSGSSAGSGAQATGTSSTGASSSPADAASEG